MRLKYHSVELHRCIRYFCYFILSAIKFWIYTYLKIRFPVLMDLHVLGYPDDDLTIFRKCPFVCDQKFYGSPVSESNAQNFKKPFV